MLCLSIFSLAVTGLWLGIDFETAAAQTPGRSGDGDGGVFQVRLSGAIGSGPVESATTSVTTGSAQFPGGGLPANIPDGGGGGCPDLGVPLNIPFEVSGLSGNISNVEVSIVAEHTWIGDLTAVLIAPTGEQHTIFDRVDNGGVNGCLGDSSNLGNGNTYTFSDTAAAPNDWWDEAANGLSTYVMAGGDYRASDITGAQTVITDTFAGLSDPNGTWTLRIRDANLVDDGSVSSATLTIATTDPVLINEIVVNPNGSDSNCEYVELLGPPSGPLTGMYFLSVEGDSSSATGQADFVIDLTAGALGTNGLLVVTGLDPSGTCDGRDYGAPQGTAVFRFAAFGGSGILENGTNSWLLVNSPTTAITPGTDLDANDDGTIDGLPGDATIVDAIGWRDGDAGDIVYGGAELPRTGVWTEDFDEPDMATRFPDNLDPVSVPAWYYGDMTGDGNSTDYDDMQVSDNFPPNGALTPGLPNVGSAAPTGSAFMDFDGDGQTDVSIFRPTESPAQWWYLRSSDDGNRAFSFGAPDDTPVPADFTGDDKTDLAFFRTSTSEWFVLRSEDSTFFSFPFGASGDIPAPGDYDGDGTDDAAVFRPSSGTWFINRSSGGTTIESFGIAEDKPVVEDYDGDGMDDIAIFRPSVSEWWVNRSQDGVIVYQFGQNGDRTVQADHTGDGKADVAFWRPTTGEWFVLRSEDSSFFSFPFGTQGDVPAPGDYDGDGQADAAVYRPSTATWFINGSTSGTEIVSFGIGTDVPLPGVFGQQ